MVTQFVMSSAPNPSMTVNFPPVGLKTRSTTRINLDGLLFAVADTSATLQSQGIVLIISGVS